MIKNISVPNPCQEKWDSMQPQENGRYCGSCQKIVIDFTNKTEQEIIDHIAANSGKKMCGTFRTTQLQQPNHFIESPKYENSIRFLAALLLVFGMSLFSCNKDEEKKADQLQDTFTTTGEVLPPPPIDSIQLNTSEADSLRTIEHVQTVCTTTTGIIAPDIIELGSIPEPFPVIDSTPKLTKDIIVGEIFEPMPEFNGGEKALAEYIKKNIIYPTVDNAIEGTVYTSFIVMKDGSIDSVKLLRGISKPYNDEALRVIKSMPKWKPATHNGKPINIQVNIPIKFTQK
ncbi:MAG: energy transducer TonB [Bacteroidia bacterium]